MTCFITTYNVQCCFYSLPLTFPKSYKVWLVITFSEKIDQRFNKRESDFYAEGCNFEPWTEACFLLPPKRSIVFCKFDIYVSYLSSWSVGKNVGLKHWRSRVRVLGESWVLYYMWEVELQFLLLLLLLCDGNDDNVMFYMIRITNADKVLNSTIM